MAGIPQAQWEYPSEPKLGDKFQWHSVLPTESRFNGSRAEIGAYVGSSPGITRTLINARDLETWAHVDPPILPITTHGPPDYNFNLLNCSAKAIRAAPIRFPTALGVTPKTLAASSILQPSHSTSSNTSRSCGRIRRSAE